MRDTTISRATGDGKTAVIVQGSSNFGLLHLKELLERNQIAEAIDYALNTSWGEDDLVEATKERIKSLIKDNPLAALNLMLAIRDKFPKREEDLVLYFSTEMQAMGV